MITYRYPPGVHVDIVGGRYCLSTPQGGKVALDSTMGSLWQQAGGRELEEIVAACNPNGAHTDVTLAALACLAEAGLLLRDKEQALPSYSNTRGDLVSVVIVSFNSRDWLQESLPSLFAQTFSPLEIILVDNASTDGSLEWLAANYPSVRLISQAKRQSFAYTINRGVAATAGAYFLLLNPDVRLEPDTIARLVDTAQSDSSCAAVVPKLKFWWAPAFLNGLGNRVDSFSWGTDNALGHLDLGQFKGWAQIPSACFAAALIPRTAWHLIGTLDEGFPMYYEDSEWSYRARLLGYRIQVASEAVGYHAFGGRLPSGAEVKLSPRKLYDVVYGRLRFAFKIVGRPLLWRFLVNYLIADCLGILGGLARREGNTVRMYWSGWMHFWRELPSLRRERRQLQARRVCSDEDLFRLQRKMPPLFIWHGLPELTWDIVRSHYLPLMRSGGTRPMPEFELSECRPRLLIVSNDIVDSKMAGPGVRYLEMARALSTRVDVTLAIPSETNLQIPDVRLISWDMKASNLQALVETSDIVLISGDMATKFPFLQNSRARIVVDLYDPIVLENLHYYVSESVSIQENLNRQAIEVTNRLARVGDFFICGSERQRDFWVGVLAANARINPYTFAHDSSLKSLIDIVGIGFPDREPFAQPMLRGLHPSFPEDCRIVLWGGGIWNWLDPLTLIQAWPEVLGKHPEARLVFLGTRHPNPLVPRHAIVERAETLAVELGEKDRTVFFFEWLPYQERERLLCEADIGVTLHPVHVETRYSIRTRVLDYFWARLPVLITEGDITSEWVKHYQLGKVVPPLNPRAVADTLCDMLDRPKQVWGPAFEPLPGVFSWSHVIEPLMKYCLDGNYAADRKSRQLATGEPVWKEDWRERIGHAIFILRTEGFRMFIHRAWRYAQWRLARQWS